MIRAGPRRSPLAAVAVYAAAALLVVALFFLLHHLGNQIDYRTAAQRFAAEFTTDRPDEGFAAGFKTRFEYCKMSVIVLAGAQPRAQGSTALREALLLREFIPRSEHYDFCAELEAAANGEVLQEQFTSPQYWFGSKAVYALLLRVTSAADIRALLRYGAYAGWVALAIALLLLAPRALVVVAPLIAFGGFFSGIHYFSDIPDGVPYLWAVWASVTLVVLLRVGLRVARLFCFFAGMVLCYLYVSAGPSILMVTLIGMLVYFVRGRGVEASRGARPAGGCIALCAAGFAAAFVLGQAAKLALEACYVPDWFGWRAVCEGVPTDRWVWRILSEKVLYVVARTGLEAAVGLSRALQAIPELAGFAELLPSPGRRDGSLQALVAPRLRAQTQSWVARAGVPIVQHFEPYWQVGLGGAAAGRALTWVAAGSLAAVTAAAVVRACRRRPALRPVGWIAALMALVGLLFLEPNDLAYRIARFLFVLYALALCSALAALTEAGSAARGAGALAGSAIVRRLARARRALAGSVIARHAARLDGLSLLLAALGALLVVLRQTTFGPGLTSHSALYVSAARSLLGGEGLVTFLGAPYREAGPLFPLVLAAAGGFGADPVTAAGFINAAAFGLTVYTVAAWVRSRVRVRLVAVWAGCACVFSTALAGAAAHVWPETLFILFAVTSLAALDCFLRAGARPALLLAAAAAAAASLTHYAGAALVGAGALLLLVPGTAGGRSRLAAGALFGGVSAAPLAAWLVGVLFLSGVSSGTTGPGSSVLRSLHTATGEVGLWLLGQGGLALLDRLAAAMAPGAPGWPSALGVALRSAVLLVPVAGAGYALTRLRSLSQRGDHTTQRSHLLYVPLVFAAAYALYLLIAIVAGLATLETRHLAPLFPPLLVAAALVLDEMIRRVRAAGGRLAAWPLAAALLAALWFLPQVGATAEQVKQQRTGGAGYASRQWSESEVVRYLNGHRPRAAIYGTDPAALYLLTAAAESGVYDLPARSGRLWEWSRLTAEAARQDYYIAWFYRDRSPLRYHDGMAALLRIPGMEIVTALDDGVLLRRNAPAAAALTAAPATGVVLPFLKDARIVVRSGFTVYVDAAAERLIYTKHECRDTDAEAQFFLHVSPANHYDLPASGESFHRLDFDFEDHGFRIRRLCVAVRALPDFPIDTLETGQFTSGDERHWTVRLENPAAPRDFAVHLLGDKLLYRRTPCAATDVQAEFFLHVIPAVAADLPAHRRAQGFDSLDFDFRTHGLAADRWCRAVVSLPAYEIARIRTGQHAAGGEPPWTTGVAASGPSPAAPATAIAKRFDDHVTIQVSERDGVTSRIAFAPADGPEDARYDQPLTVQFTPPADWFGAAVEVTRHGRLVARIPAFTEEAAIALRPNQGPYLLQPAYTAPGIPEVAAALEGGAAHGSPGADHIMRSLLKDAGISLQSRFTVHLDAAAKRLIYTKTGCVAADTAARFFLHVTPINNLDLPATADGAVFHNLDFDFAGHGLRGRGRCVAIRDLPGYPIARIDTGQFTRRAGQLWKVTVAEPAALRAFAVHLRGDNLIYLKWPCTAGDAQAQFFLRLEHRRGSGAANLDFDFHDYGRMAGGSCRAVVPLPAAEIAAVRTGQNGAGGKPLWAAEFAASRPPPAPSEITVAKWLDDHTAAISITYGAVPRGPNRIDDLVLDMGLTLDYEMVSQRYLGRLPDWVAHDLTQLIPEVFPGQLYDRLTDSEIAYGLSLTDHGFGFFGRGHWHVDHDALSYAQAYDSFRLNYEVMERLGLKPVAYAYPRGAGEEAETQQALADAGFLAGRRSAGQSPYVVPDDETAPENWFSLPGVTMESIDFRQCEWCINDTRELVPLLNGALDRTAWIIPVYHNIGWTEGWGYYEWEDFQTDLRAIAARDFWVAPMNDVVLYLREREHAEVTMQVSERDGVTSRIAFVLADGLDNDRYDQPLTVLFTPPADWFGAAVEVTRHGRLVARIPAFTEEAAITLLPDEEPYLLQPADRASPAAQAPTPRHGADDARGGRN